MKNGFPEVPVFLRGPVEVVIFFEHRKDTAHFLDGKHKDLETLLINVEDFLLVFLKNLL